MDLINSQRKLEDEAFERRVSERAGEEPTGFWRLWNALRGSSGLRIESPESGLVSNRLN